jgi:hypothetical protein
MVKQQHDISSCFARQLQASAAIRSGPVGLSNMYRDGLAQLDAAMILYDAFYR